jgi:long-chain acyl-CoA synthetase
MFNEILTRFAKRHPAKAAVITGESSIAYGELDLAVSCLAQHLLDCGLQSGDRVAVHWHNSVELVIVMLGAWRAGLIVVPINPRLKTPEIAYVLEHSGARICFSEPELAELVSGVEVRSDLPMLTGKYEELPVVDPDAAAMLLYTSGTTARPKGVVHTQRTLFEGARTMVGLATGSIERPLALSQLAHVGALECVYLPGLIQGASVVLLRKFEAGSALDVIERFGCTYTFALPAFLQLMAEEQAARPRNVSSLRGIIAGGDSAPAALQRRVRQQFHVELQEGLGMTEVVPIAITPHGAVRVGSVGPAASASIRILDANGNDVEPGSLGEVVLRSRASCVGYWNNPEATAHLFEGGWLHTGDLASLDEDGYLWFKGRLKQIIVCGGSNISPQEVEEALYQHPAVLEAGVVGLPDPSFGEIPVAFISLREGRHAEKDQLHAHARALLSDCKVPRRIYFMDELPKGLTGKVDRRRLREILLADADLIENNAIVGV